MHGLNEYDYAARYYDPGFIRFTTMDPHSENYYSWSPYAYVANNPLRLIDPDGKDYWSTNDPELIKGFFNAMGSGSNKADLSGWNHASDSEFLGNATFNDETGIFYTSYGTVENGEATVTSVSFNTDIKYPIIGINSNNNALSLPIAITSSIVETSIELGFRRIIPAISIYEILEKQRLDYLNSHSLSFSKTARGNHRDDGLADWTDDDIKEELNGLTGALNKEQKALKQKLKKEQKVRGERNKQKKSGEKGVGTGRR